MQVCRSVFTAPAAITQYIDRREREERRQAMHEQTGQRQKAMQEQTRQWQEESSRRPTAL
jgi:hypothetical protein